MDKKLCAVIVILLAIMAAVFAIGRYSREPAQEPVSTSIGAKDARDAANDAELSAAAADKAAKSAHKAAESAANAQSPK